MKVDNIFFEIVPTEPKKALGLEIWFDNCCLVDQPKFNKNLEFSHNFKNTSDSHSLKIILKHKTPLHTVVTAQNQIVSDAAIKIQNFKLNKISILGTFLNRAVYQSNELGTIPLIGCFGYVGFNGQIVFDFESPVDNWVVNNYI